MGSLGARGEYLAGFLYPTLDALGPFRLSRVSLFTDFLFCWVEEKDDGRALLY